VALTFHYFKQIEDYLQGSTYLIKYGPQMPFCANCEYLTWEGQTEHGAFNGLAKLLCLWYAFGGMIWIQFHMLINTYPIS
jgi:hypothetical protein